MARGRSKEIAELDERYEKEKEKSREKRKKFLEEYGVAVEEAIDQAKGLAKKSEKLGYDLGFKQDADPELSWACEIAGCRLRYTHNDLRKFESLLARLERDCDFISKNQSFIKELVDEIDRLGGSLKPVKESGRPKMELKAPPSFNFSHDDRKQEIVLNEANYYWLASEVIKAHRRIKKWKTATEEARSERMGGKQGNKDEK